MTSDKCDQPTPDFGACPIQIDSYRVDVTDMLTGEALHACEVPASVVNSDDTPSYSCAKCDAESFWRRIMRAAGL